MMDLVIKWVISSYISSMHFAWGQQALRDIEQCHMREFSFPGIMTQKRLELDIVKYW